MLAVQDPTVTVSLFTVGGLIISGLVAIIKMLWVNNRNTEQVNNAVNHRAPDQPTLVALVVQQSEALGEIRALLEAHVATPHATPWTPDLPDRRRH